MKASAVPIATPALVNSLTSGMTPAAFEYNGMPKNVKKNLIALLGLAGFIVMADNWVVSPLLPAISQNLNIDIAKAGLLISAYMIPFGIFQVIFGLLAESSPFRNVQLTIIL
ncbi:major facilitator superfamily protein [Desulfosporosinus acididurans]|uniref:Major facilitator superfamily protein n=1 Tax=Desulfosporosinus acididurans TaxID=476652 RepID=A0A0J1FQM5_9FIRM|nr:major facilitator superfamily protein [Desulfosporosinus acididurans]